MFSDFIPSNSILIQDMPSTLMFGRCWLYGKCARKNSVVRVTTHPTNANKFLSGIFCKTLDDEIRIKIYNQVILCEFFWDG